MVRRHLLNISLKSNFKIILRSPRNYVHQDQLAVARYITAYFDQEFSLTVDQHKNLAQLLLDATADEAFPISTRLLEIDDILEAVELVNDTLKIPLDGLLTLTQGDIFYGVFAKKAIRGGKGGETEFPLREFAEAKLAAHTARFVAAHTALLGPPRQRCVSAFVNCHQRRGSTIH